MKFTALRTAVAAALCVVVTHAPAQTHTVQAPHYGDALFHFFQDQWFDAVTGLMVSQHFGRVAPHDDEAEILRGGLLLSYGLHNEAGAVFAKLIDGHATPAVRDRAWFFLARMRYQRSLLADAETALARIANPLPGELEDERSLLQAQLRLARNDPAGAAAVLQTVPTKAAASQYARFNLGVALVKSGDSARGNALLDEIGRAPAANEEQRSLRDRANVALGFAALQAQRPQQARDALQRVRLVGAQANKALLGFGWAATELKAPKDALVPWTELAGRDASDSAVLEAKIAVPYALAELGALNQSLAGYNAAIELYDGERKRLDESIQAIRAGALVGALLQRNPQGGMGAFGGIANVPTMPHAGHWSQLLAGHEFQESFKNLRDLQFLDRNISDWSSRLGVFGDMLAHRRQAFEQRLPRVLQRAGELSLPALQQRRDTLAAELARSEEQVDPQAFVDERERALLERIQRVEAALKTTADADIVERLRRVKGALTWQLARDYQARLWDAKKGLRATDKTLAEAGEHQAALARAQKDEPARFERFAARIAELEARLQALNPRVASLGREQQGQLQEMAVAELESQKQRLDAYAAQARLAIAQLYDRAQVASRTSDSSEGGNDAKR